MRLRLTVALLVMLFAAPLAAQQTQQQQQQQQDTTKLTPKERALLRLRALNRVGAPDTTSPVPQDSIRQQPQRVQVAGRGTPEPGASIMPRDSVVEALLKLRDYSATEYRGDTARYSADSARLELRGNPQVSRQGNQLSAKDLIVYDRTGAFTCGYGKPELRTPQMTNPVVSDTVCYDIERRLGYARGAQTKVEEGATWDMLLDNMYFDERTDDVYSLGGKFTDCDLPWDHKHYYVDAKEIKVVRHNVMVARNVTWYFADVPVFWIPWMVQSLSRGRRSGILMPRFGVNDIARQSSRYSRRIEDVGFYFALGDHMGAQISGDWFADNWTALAGALDFRWNQQFLNGGATFRRFWRAEGGREFTLSAQSSWQPDERTQVSLSANYTTSTQFIRSRSFDPRELNRSIDSNASLRRRFGSGASVSIGGTRRQFMSDNTVTLNVPFSLSIPNLTLFEAEPGEERWYSGMTWNGFSPNITLNRATIGAENTNRTAQSTQTVTSSGGTGFRIGGLTLQQNASFRDESRDRREFAGDTITPLPAFAQQSGNWATTLSFQIPLIGTTAVTPNISMGSEFIRNDSSGNTLVMAPTRMSVGAGISLNAYGFYPGIGPFSRFRHRFNPSFGYSYSPATTADSLQRRLFPGSSVGLEQNQLIIGLQQTFEAKPRAVEVEDTAGAAAGDTTGAPRRRQQVQPITLLSIQTSNVTYDFVGARNGDAIPTNIMTNSISSDLLKGLTFSMQHELFHRDPSTVPGQQGDRKFSPHLSNVSADFSLNSNNWLFRFLGLGRRDSIPTAQGAAPLQPGDPNQAGPPIDRTQPEYGLIGTGRRNEIGQPRGSVGQWNAALTYSLLRPRQVPGSFNQDENSSLTGRFQFQPTTNWSVNWMTGYSFTTGEFTDHNLSLTRSLHDWDASFTFIKAQNGNFAFTFNIHLRANPDVKLDYSQNDLQGVGRRF